MKIKSNLISIRKSILIALALSVVVVALALLNKSPMHQPVKAAFAPPIFDQALIDEAMGEPMHGLPDVTPLSRQAAIMLAVVARLHPNATSSSGALVRENVATQIHEFLKPGQDHRNTGVQGPGFGATASVAIIALARYTPAVWNLLSEDDRNRADWYMRMAAIVGNRKHNEANNCHLSFGLNNGGGSAPNQRPDMRQLSYVWIYFGGAEAVNDILTSFNYDTYMNQFNAFGWSRNITEWNRPNVREITENGGTFGNCTVNPDGANRPFTVIRGRIASPPLDCAGFGFANDSQLLPYTPINIFRREEHEFQFGSQVVDRSCLPNAAAACNEYGRLLSGAPSPHLGKVGMFFEYNLNSRSSPEYVTLGGNVSIVHYAVLAALGFWDSGNPEYDEMEDRFWIAMDDAFYKNDKGWFDNVTAFCKDKNAFSLSQGSRYTLGLWNTMFQDKGIVWRPSAAEINVQGNAINIVSGDTTPNAHSHTIFGSVSESNGTVTRTFTIQNTGTDDLILTGSPIVTLSGDNAADFIVTEQPATSVAAGGSTTFEVRFDPSAVGPRLASIRIGNNDANENPYNFSIKGMGNNSGGGRNATVEVGATDAFSASEVSDGDITTMATPANFEIHFEVGFTGEHPSITYPGRGFQPADRHTLKYEQFFIPDSGNNNAALPTEINFKNWVMNTNPGGAAYTGQWVMDIEITWEDRNNATHRNNRQTLIRWAQEVMPNAKVGLYGYTPKGIHPSSIPEGGVKSDGKPPTWPYNNDNPKHVGDQANALWPSHYPNFKSFYNWEERERSLFQETLRVYGSAKLNFPYISHEYEGIGNGDLTEYNFLQMLWSIKNGGVADGLVFWNNPGKTDSWSSQYALPWWKAMRKFVGLDSHPRELEVRGNNVVIVDNDTSPTTGDHTDFGTVSASSGSVTRTFTIKNVATGSNSILTFGLPNLSDYTHFRVTQDPRVNYTDPVQGAGSQRMVLFAGESVTFQIRFDPASTGAKTAIVSFHTNDLTGGEQFFNFTIKGAGQ